MDRQTTKSLRKYRHKIFSFLGLVGLAICLAVHLAIRNVVCGAWPLQVDFTPLYYEVTFLALWAGATLVFVASIMNSIAYFCEKCSANSKWIKACSEVNIDMFDGMDPDFGGKLLDKRQVIGWALPFTAGVYVFVVTLQSLVTPCLG